MFFMGAMLREGFSELSPLTEDTLLSIAVGLHMVLSAQFD
jgi:hypothetical protein